MTPLTLCASDMMREKKWTVLEARFTSDTYFPIPDHQRHHKLFQCPEHGGGGETGRRDYAVWGWGEEKWREGQDGEKNLTCMTLLTWVAVATATALTAQLDCFQWRTGSGTGSMGTLPIAPFTSPTLRGRATSPIAKLPMRHHSSPCLAMPAWLPMARLHRALHAMERFLMPPGGRRPYWHLL